MKAPMAHGSPHGRTRWPASAIAAALSLAGTAHAQTSLTPNLIPLPAFNTTLATDAGGRSTLRFSTTTWNGGAGPLELAAGDVETGSGKLRVYQVVYLGDGSSTLHFAGAFEFHPEHGDARVTRQWAVSSASRAERFTGTLPSGPR